ncbi:MAG: glycoside hydrolase family 2 [Bacteroides sp.]|nr:glycoside hydrolase family 2 [Bacteroides sp.]
MKKLLLIGLLVCCAARVHATENREQTQALCAAQHALIPNSEDSAKNDWQDARLVFPFPFAPSEGLVNRLEKPYRQEICLNGYWEFQPVSLPSDYVQGKGIAPELPLPRAEAWSTARIKIPSPWNINAFAYRNLEGPDHRNYPSYPREWEEVKMAWMKKVVDVPADWEGQAIRLHFEAVAGQTVVYVNGQKAGENFDLFLPFSLDVTSLVSPGEQAEVLVGVRSQSLFEDNSTVGRRIVPAGSMWGYHIAGIWQDVYLQALPKLHIEDVFVKPLVGRGILELEVTVRNHTSQRADVRLGGDISEWLNLAGTDVISAPVPAWELGRVAMTLPETRVAIEPDAVRQVTLQLPVGEEVLKYWTPEQPNLYALLLSLKQKKQVVDTKYERFGWREWTLQGTTHCLNGKPYALHGDSWHFMGVPQMTRRYAWAWFTAIKGMNGNAVRPHAQVYPRFYLDMADEMGICVLNETANWASDGGPKLDSDHFWKASKEHLRRFVMRDRNHASVFGWSISNENKPVILHVFNRPDLMPGQLKAWEEWRDIVRECDPTRPWISSDGEDDGNGILPVTVGHYGDMNSMKHWIEIGKPWGIGEHSMAYYGTPEQVSVYNGERAYESQEGRMEGLANECYNLIANQRRMGASYSTVFNMVWYALKPLPLGKRDLTSAPSLATDGVFFSDYREGVPGIQPERVGPYCTTFNPGYDPALPLFDPWPLYEAMRAANAPGAPAWSPYAEVEKQHVDAAEAVPAAAYKEIVFIGNQNSNVKQLMETQGVKFAARASLPVGLLYVVDGSYTPTAKEMEQLRRHADKGADIWIWGLVPEQVECYNRLLPLPVAVDRLERSSFLPVQKSWMRGLNNSDFYFCELQRAHAARYTLKGQLVDEGEVLLHACKTDWRKWNKRPEELKTAGVLRSEYECTAATPVFVKCRQGNASYYVSTLTEFANSEKGFHTLAAVLKNAGVPCSKVEANGEEMFFLRDGQLHFPAATVRKMQKQDASASVDIYVFSPRPLDDLLIEPNMPKLSLVMKPGAAALSINGKPYKMDRRNNEEVLYKELPLLQGWNRLTIQLPADRLRDFSAYFRCDNRNDFLPLLKASFIPME